jgi:hypothetical protein
MLEENISNLQTLKFANGNNSVSVRGATAKSIMMSNLC